MLNPEFLIRKTVHTPLVSPRMRIQNSELSHWSDSLNIRPIPNAQSRIPNPKNRPYRTAVSSDENSEFGIEPLVRFPQHPTNTKCSMPNLHATAFCQRLFAPAPFSSTVPPARPDALHSSPLTIRSCRGTSKTASP